MKNIYVGNLPFSSTENELRSLFETYGQVDRVQIVMDRETGRPRGFAFVEMTDDANGNAAIEALDGQEFGGRNLRVNEAQARQPRSGAGSGGPRGGGGGGGGGRRDGGGRGGGRGGW